MPRATSAQDLQLVVGVPEANAPGAELGVGQFANILNFESLTINGPDGRALPRLAERWQWEQDDLRLRVTLRPDVIMHDGRPLQGEVAADVVRRAVTHPRNLARYPAFADIASVQSALGRDLLFDLTRPSATLPEDLTVPLDVGPESTGTGPFKIVSKGSDVVLERFDQYYLGKPTITRVVVKSFNTLRTSWASLLRGEVDMVYDVPADAVQFISNDDVQVVSVPRWYQYHIAFNSSRGPLRSPLVRKALNMAVDRQKLVDSVIHGGEPSTGPIYPRYWAYDSTVTPYGFDPAQAAALLDSAGFPMPGASPTNDAAPARMRFVCLLPENFTVWERIALEVQKSLLNVGVDVQFAVVPFDEYNKRVGAGDFDALFIDMISGPSPARAYIWWRSAREFRGLNVFGYENGEAERLFTVLRRSTSDAAIRSATRRLQQVFFDDPPALFLAWDARARAIRREFQRPDEGRDPMLSLWRWNSSSARQARASE